LLSRGFQYNDLDPERITKLKDQIGSEAQKSILVVDYEVTQAPLKNESQEFFQTRLAIIQARAEVGQDFERIKVSQAMGFKLLLLSFQILLLVMT
jgi:hypothetical protein